MIDNLIDFIAIIFGVFLAFLHSFIIGLYMPYLNFYINIILLFVYILSSIRGNKKLFILFLFCSFLLFGFHFIIMIANLVWLFIFKKLL